MTAAVIYAAKSTEDVHGSIPTQLADCRQLAEREGWEVVGEFSDEAFSAWKRDRGPGLKAACEAAAAVEGTCILVAQHSDRFARGDGRTARHLGELLFWAMRNEVELRSVQDDSTFTNPLLTFAMGERNAEDSRRKSLATKAGMRRRAEKGLHNGGKRPYGYRWVGEKGDKRLVVEPGEAALVRRIFSDYAAGRSQRDITSALNAEGIRTASGAQWCQAGVRVILKNPVYAGRVGHSETFDGIHEAIVNPRLWDQIADMREANAKSRGGGRGRLPKNHLFVRGMLRCAKCGEAMRPRTSERASGSLHERYECSGRYDKRICDQAPVPRTTIDGAALRYFEQTALDVTATREQIRAAAQAKVDEVEALREQVERDRMQRGGQRSRIEADYLAGHLSAETYERLDARLVEELEALAAQASRLAEQATQIRPHGQFYDAEDALMEQLTALRAAVAGEVTSAVDIGALRVALARVFECFIYDAAAGENARLIPLVRDTARTQVYEFEVDGQAHSIRYPAKTPLPYTANKEAFSLP